jgi:hypothetical protein
MICFEVLQLQMIQEDFLTKEHTYRMRSAPLRSLKHAEDNSARLAGSGLSALFSLQHFYQYCRHSIGTECSAAYRLSLSSSLSASLY